jgi:hypothetical protein
MDAMGHRSIHIVWFFAGCCFKEDRQAVNIYSNVSPVSMILAKYALPESMIPVKHSLLLTVTAVKHALPKFTARQGLLTFLCYTGLSDMTFPMSLILRA